MQDVSAVVEYKGMVHVGIGQHVLTNWEDGNEFFIGYVTAVASEEFNDYTVTFDDNDEAIYNAGDLTEFPEHNSAQNGKEGIVNNYSPKWWWLASRLGKYPPLIPSRHYPLFWYILNSNIA